MDAIARCDVHNGDRSLIHKFAVCLLICGVAAVASANSETCETPVNPGPGITPPRIVSSEGPAMPNSADTGLRGKVVMVGVVVGTNGKPCNLEVRQSAGPEFDRAALDAVARWKWKPATRDKKPVAVHIFVEVSFLKTRS